MSWKGPRGPVGGTEEQMLESVLKDMLSSLGKLGGPDADGNCWAPVDYFAFSRAVELLEHYRDALAGMRKGLENMGNELKREEERANRLGLKGIAFSGDLENGALTDIGVGGVIRTGSIDPRSVGLDEPEGV